MIIRYLATLTAGKITLWCYLIWYCATLLFYFDPSPRLWINSLGISVVIGIALLLSVAKPHAGASDYWQVFRLFMMPFGVSSFSSLIKGQGFILIIPPRPIEQLVFAGACVLFVCGVCLVKWMLKPGQ